MTDYLDNDPGARWAELVPEISREDPVLGGRGGPVNAPHQALADRTEWLRANMPTRTDIQGHISQLDPHGACAQPEPGRLVLRDAEGRAQVADPAGDLDIANKKYVEDQVKNTVSLSSSGGTYRRLKITASASLADPSKGRAAEFRVTMVGGGGGGIYVGENNTSSSITQARGGGGAEGLSFRFYSPDVTWPIQIYVGLAGVAGRYVTSNSSYVSATHGGSTIVLDRYVQGGEGVTAGASGYTVGARGGGADNPVNGYVTASATNTVLGGGRRRRFL